MAILNIKAIIMAAGRGRRMGRITSFGEGLHLGNMPKPTLPVVNRPIICRAIDQLATRGVTDFWVTSHHLAGDVVKIVGHGERFGTGVEIRHVIEYPLVHTALATKQIADKFGKNEPFWVLSGDIFSPHTDFTSFYANFIEARRRSKHVAGSVGFVLRPAEEIINRYTTAIINSDGLIESFEERPTSMEEAERIFNSIQNETVKRVSDELGQMVLPINSSTYLMTRRVFEHVPEPKTNPVDLYDFGRYVFVNLPPCSTSAFLISEEIADNRLGRTWTDIGFPEDLWRANFRLIRYAPYLIQGKYIPGMRSWIGNNSKIRGDIANSVIGNNVFIGPDVRVENSIVGPGTTIEGLGLLRGSIVLPFTYINTRRYARRVEEIINSLLISRTAGGTFIDAHSTGARTIDNRVAIPDIDGQIKFEDLYLDPEEIESLFIK